ncbi:PH domain-containing protein [Acinetobacter radioresistens]|uniref:PH domain-containing protein n=1 Tax=Acinetobacter radioresistens TaxID=40216 RepID=UPI00157B569F|nr:PH domain-containing protein [Acinetobacter radioresistens]NTY95988.1 PH domain-containing protein [Acinetobacter radioresistens]
MGSYIEQNLARDERIIIKAQVTWLSQFWYLFFGGLFILSSLGSKNGVPFFIGLILIAIAAIHVLTTELALTNRRIIAKSGLIRRNTIELKANHVESLGVDQGILGRIFNFGSIVIKGTGGSHAPIPYIARPLEFRQQVNNFLDELDDSDQRKP